MKTSNLVVHKSVSQIPDTLAVEGARDRFPAIREGEGPANRRTRRSGLDRHLFPASPGVRLLILSCFEPVSLTSPANRLLDQGRL